jgi:hypothetical protein
MHRLIAFHGGSETAQATITLMHRFLLHRRRESKRERQNQSPPPPIRRRAPPPAYKLARITGLKTRKLLPPPPVVLQAQSAATTNSKIRRRYFSAQNIVRPPTTLNYASAYLSPSLRFLPKLSRRRAGRRAQRIDAQSMVGFVPAALLLAQTKTGQLTASSMRLCFWSTQNKTANLTNTAPVFL